MDYKHLVFEHISNCQVQSFGWFVSPWYNTNILNIRQLISILWTSFQFSQDNSSAMNIFGSIRIYLLDLGIHSSQSNKNRYENVKSLIMLFLFILSAFLSCSFHLFQEKTLEEWENAFVEVVTMISVFCCMAICVWKADAIFKFMMNLEVKIQQSEFVANH